MVTVARRAMLLSHVGRGSRSCARCPCHTCRCRNTRVRYRLERLECESRAGTASVWTQLTGGGTAMSHVRVST
eukprot:1424585-Prymnesium_polylepis.1